MSDLVTIRTAIVALMTGLDVGLVHGHERYAHNKSDLKDLYVGNQGMLRGWHVRRVSTRESSEELGRYVRDYRWSIRGFRALEDADGSEQLFDGDIETICNAFRADDELGGVVATCIVGQEAGIQVQDSGPVMFAGVLCHSAKLALTTRVYL